MTKKTYSSAGKGADGNYRVRVSELEHDEDGIVTGDKTGFLMAVTADGANKLLEGLKDGTRVATFGSRIGTSSLYEVTSEKKAQMV